MHNWGAVANGCGFEHVEALAGKGDERTRADGFLFHESDGFWALDGHDGIDEVECGIKATAERVYFKDDVVRFLFESFTNSSGAEFVHGGVDVAFQFNPDSLLLWG